MNTPTRPVDWFCVQYNQEVESHTGNIRIDLSDSFGVTNNAKPITPAQWISKPTQCCVCEKGHKPTNRAVAHREVYESNRDLMTSVLRWLEQLKHFNVTRPTSDGLKPEGNGPDCKRVVHTPMKIRLGKAAASTFGFLTSVKARGSIPLRYRVTRAPVSPRSEEAVPTLVAY